MVSIFSLLAFLASKTQVTTERYHMYVLTTFLHSVENDLTCTLTFSIPREYLGIQISLQTKKSNNSETNSKELEFIHQQLNLPLTREGEGLQGAYKCKIYLVIN